MRENTLRKSNVKREMEKRGRRRKTHKKLWRKRDTRTFKTKGGGRWPRLGVGRVDGEEKTEALGAGSLPRARRLPRASLLRFLQRKGNPGKPLWATFVCSRPGSDDAVDLVFKQWVCSLLGWGRGLLAILNPAYWIEFRPL